MKNLNRNTYRKGQILLGMITLMVLSLALGISITGGFIRNVKDITQMDDLSKAKSASEALLEKLLLVPNETLEDYIEGNNCGSVCSWSVTDVTGQVITAEAVLSYAGNTVDVFSTEISTTSVFQVNLNGYPSGSVVDVCWDGPTSVYANYIKESSGVLSSDAYAYNSISTAHPENGFLQALGNHGFENCFTVTASNTPKLLRIRPLYLNTIVHVVPQAGLLLPIQGLLITVTGVSGDSSKVTSALKTTAAPPPIFDYVIYQKSSTDPLSNVTL